MSLIFSQIRQIRDRVGVARALRGGVCRCLVPLLLPWGAGVAPAGEAVVYTPWDGEYGAYVIADDPGRVRAVAELVGTEVGGQPAGVLALALRRAPAQVRRIELSLDGEPWLDVELDAEVSDFGVVLPRLTVLRDIGITLRIGEDEGLVRVLSVAEGVGARFPELDPGSWRDSLQLRAGSESQRWLTFRCAPATNGAPLKFVGLDAGGGQTALLRARMQMPGQHLIGDVGISSARAARYQLDCEDTAGQRRSVKADDSG